MIDNKLINDKRKAEHEQIRAMEETQKQMNTVNGEDVDVNIKDKYEKLYKEQESKLTLIQTEIRELNVQLEQEAREFCESTIKHNSGGGDNMGKEKAKAKPKAKAKAPVKKADSKPSRADEVKALVTKKPSITRKELCEKTGIHTGYISRVLKQAGVELKK